MLRKPIGCTVRRLLQRAGFFKQVGRTGNQGEFLLAAHQRIRLVQPPRRLQLSGRLVDPFCQPLPYAHETFVADRADAADKQFAVEDGEARQAEEAGGFQAGVGEIGIGGRDDFIESLLLPVGFAMRPCRRASRRNWRMPAAT